MLNPYQKGALEVDLRLLEATIRNVLRLIREPHSDGLLTRVRPFPVGDRARLEGLLETMFTEVAAVVQEFELQPQDEEIGGRIRAEMAVAWSDLHEVLSKKLRRYGKVDPLLSTSLDPHLRRLIQLTMEVSLLAENAPNEEAR